MNINLTLLRETKPHLHSYDWWLNEIEHFLTNHGPFWMDQGTKYDVFLLRNILTSSISVMYVKPASIGPFVSLRGSCSKLG